MCGSRSQLPLYPATAAESKLAFCLSATSIVFKPVPTQSDVSDGVKGSLHAMIVRQSALV